MGKKRCTKSNLTAATVDAIAGSTLMGPLTGVQSVTRLGSAKVEHMQRRLSKGLEALDLESSRNGGMRAAGAT